ncbi:MAG: hypothetical protein U0792_16715 [Gemmataceae bacterium]
MCNLPKVFTEKGFIFVSTNYRLLPSVDMETIIRDVGQVHPLGPRPHRGVHADPADLRHEGTSAQPAAIICTDDRYLKDESCSTSWKDAVDGDTYDVPAIIAIAEARWKAHGLPPAKFGHREKFGNSPEKHKDFSAVTHVAKGKGIPPFLLLYVAGHPDVTAQAVRLGNVMKEAGLPVKLFGARESTHNKLNADIGLPDDPATKELSGVRHERPKELTVSARAEWSPLHAVPNHQLQRAPDQSVVKMWRVGACPLVSILGARPACQHRRHETDPRHHSAEQTRRGHLASR